jgi:hypothetical protein
MHPIPFNSVALVLYNMSVPYLTTSLAKVNKVVVVFLGLLLFYSLDDDFLDKNIS